MVNPDSYWSVVTAGAAALIAACVLLLWIRPNFVLQKNEDGAIEHGRISVTRLFVFSALIAAAVVGLTLYIKWHRGRNQ